jgi:hypothetical protein
MRGKKTLGLCLVVALAMMGLLATSAFAESLPVPTWYACVKAVPKDSGNYTEKACATASEPGKGGYELEESIGKGKEFKGKLNTGTKAILHIKTWLGDLKVECESAKDSGKPALPNLEVGVAIDYGKCKALGTKTCTTAGAKKGEIKATGMRGEFGYVEETPTPVVGLRLENEAHPGELLTTFTCEDVEGKVAGQVIGLQEKDIGAINKDSELFDEATERYGEHEYEGKKIQADREHPRLGTRTA